MQKSVVLVDDHKLVRDGFVQIIEMSEKYKVIGSYSTFDEVVQSQSLMSADMLITDISLDSELDGFDLIKAAKSINPCCKVIIVSMFENAVYLQQAKELNIDGFIHKREASEFLLKALDEVFKNNSFFSGEIANGIEEAEDALCAYNELFPRELEVFLLIAKGHPVKTIAVDLNIAVKTVHTHRLNLYKKFGFTNAFDITRFCLKHGILDNSDFE